MIDLRQNSCINKVIIHHTDTSNFVTGKQLNLDAIANSMFGLVFDIIINVNGNIDLSPRWIYATQGSQYIQNVPLRGIINNYPKHYLSAAGDNTDTNLTTVHIAVIGNFNITEPSIHQLHKLVEVIAQISYELNLCIHKGELKVLYHSDAFKVSCPGILFIDEKELKNKIIAKVKKMGRCK